MREIMEIDGSDNEDEADPGQSGNDADGTNDDEINMGDNGDSGGTDEAEWDEFKFVWRRDPLPPLRSASERLFVPPKPSDTPSSLFKPGRPSPMTSERIVRMGERSEGLIFTDGACLNNGQANPTAGWAFVISTAPLRAYSGRLELKGADGQHYPQTSNRAELRAVIAASQFRAWDGEQFRRIIFASDSEYVVRGATEWMSKWVDNRWRNNRGKPVANCDLWKVLLRELEKWDQRGLRVLFWHIPRGLNELADRKAKEAAAEETVNESLTEILGIAM
ncbi:MAG: hypothetical protein Q9160_001142 [Pyrenula sp. 1 TL-2023]